MHVEKTQRQKKSAQTKKTLQSQSEGNHETPVKDDTDQFHTRMSWSTGETSGWQSVTGIYHASYAQRYFAWDGEWGFISSELGRRCNWYSVISPYVYRACRAMILLVKWKTTVMITARFRLWLYKIHKVPGIRQTITNMKYRNYKKQRSNTTVIRHLQRQQQHQRREDTT